MFKIKSNKQFKGINISYKKNRFLKLIIIIMLDLGKTNVSESA